MKCISLFVAFFICLKAVAQTDSFSAVQQRPTVSDSLFRSLSTRPELKSSPPKVWYPKNVIKMNVTSLLFKNYNFVAERSLTRKISASLGYRTMPTTKLSNVPALKNAYKITGDDEETLEEDWSNMTASNSAVTAEFRFYGGRKPGPRGFYLGLYGRYAKFDLDYDYAYETNSQTYNIPIQATAKGIGGGLFIGVQWLIGKRVALDWQLLGGHWGKLTGDGNGVADLSAMSEQDKENLRYNLEDQLPSVGDKSSIQANVTNSGVRLKVDGPFAGLRSGISIGFSF